MYLTSYIILKRNNQAAGDWTVTIRHDEEEIEKLTVFIPKRHFKGSYLSNIRLNHMKLPFFRPKVIQVLTTNRIET